MQFQIGDSITYKLESEDGELVKGKIIAIAENRLNMVTTYLAHLITGEYIQIKPDNLNKCKLEEPAKRQVIRTSPLMLPVALINTYPHLRNYQEYPVSSFSID